MMTDEQKALIAAVAATLQCPRDRLHRLTDYRAPQNAMRKLADDMGLMKKLPHGGTDVADQCAMILQALADVPVKSLHG